MAAIEYTCDACDAEFEVDPKLIPEGEVVMCPECGETEIVHITCPVEESSCQVIPGTKRKT